MIWIILILCVVWFGVAFYASIKRENETDVILLMGVGWMFMLLYFLLVL